MIERVYFLNEGEKVHYPQHQVVIRKKAETTKLRVVYDTSLKECKDGTSLNDCLHVGPLLTWLLYDSAQIWKE